MEVIIGSTQNVKRTKGLRSVKKNQKKLKINTIESTHNKLFNSYLVENPKGSSPNYKLGDQHRYYSDLLSSRKEIQYMNMILLSQVLLYLKSVNDKLPDTPNSACSASRP